MEKWADYCISKLSFKEGTEVKRISHVIAHKDNGDTIGESEERDRNWLVQKCEAGISFCCITKNENGKWNYVCSFSLNNGGFNWDADLPLAITRRKSFVSYYHREDEDYRDRFDNLFGDLVVNKSVEDGDIDSDNSDDYIKQLIQKKYLHDTTVLVVLIGTKTKCRKHVDWEISGALNLKVGGIYAGLLGLILPNHPDYGTGEATYSRMPDRLADNFKSEYAFIADWTDDRAKMQSYIEDAYSRRTSKKVERDNSRAQMSRNTCE